MEGVDTKKESIFWGDKTKKIPFESQKGFFGGAGEIRTRVQIRRHRTVYMLSHLLFFRP